MFHPDILLKAALCLLHIKVVCGGGRQGDFKGETAVFSPLGAAGTPAI
ncbi:hypothetical protein [Thalassotalea insulae]|nr:hypothetical protein [Thalassotalea insulae]